MVDLHWKPNPEVTSKEQQILKRVSRRRKLYGFLREHRLDLFNDAFQTELAAMYRTTGQGQAPVKPAVLAIATLMQAYEGLSDGDAVDRATFDLRWRMVLGVLDTTEAPFSQAALCAFRERLLAHEMDRRLLERTVELARETGAFDWKKLPKTLHLAVDSRPLEGAGRVEDTFNLIGHAARNLLAIAAALADESSCSLAKAIGTPLFASGSIKRNLDIEWGDPAQKGEALAKLLEQVDALEKWVRERFPEQSDSPPLAEPLETLKRAREQDIEPDPSDPSGRKQRIREGVAEDRRISIEDPEMRHGRKSKSRTINGYKSHLGLDLRTELILACAMAPANRPEAEALGPILSAVRQYPDQSLIGALYIDCGYLSAPETAQLAANDIDIICKPRALPSGSLFPKTDFIIDLRKKLITCPAGNTQPIELGTIVQFPSSTCVSCPMRAQCTKAVPERGRTIRIAHDEPLQQQLRKAASTPAGRRRLRKRVSIEHKLAHLSQKQGRRARYKGVKKNLLDLRRHSAVLNLETIQRAKAA